MGKLLCMKLCDRDKMKLLFKNASTLVQKWTRKLLIIARSQIILSIWTITLSKNWYENQGEFRYDFWSEIVKKPFTSINWYSTKESVTNNSPPHSHDNMWTFSITVGRLLI